MLCVNCVVEFNLPGEMNDSIIIWKNVLEPSPPSWFTENFQLFQNKWMDRWCFREKMENIKRIFISALIHMENNI